MSETERLPRSFYLRQDVIQLSRDLLGCKLVHNTKEGLCSGIIVETEAYAGFDDKASHAHMGRFTNRTKVMYEEGGTTYVYLCYGIHHLFNIVTNKKGSPHAILVRAIEPTYGIDLMLKRRDMQKLEKRITAGPGSLTKAMGITKELNGKDLVNSESIWIEKGENIADHKIKSGPRVGIDYAGDDKHKPWRFSIKENPFVSPAK